MKKRKDTTTDGFRNGTIIFLIVVIIFILTYLPSIL